MTRTKVEQALRLAILYLDDADHRLVALEALDEITPHPYPQEAKVRLVYHGDTVEIGMRDYGIVLNYMIKNNKLKAVQHLRRISRLGLKEAHNAVSNYENGFPQRT